MYNIIYDNNDNNAPVALCDAQQYNSLKKLVVLCEYLLDKYDNDSTLIPSKDKSRVRKLAKLVRPFYEVLFDLPTPKINNSVAIKDKKAYFSDSLVEDTYMVNDILDTNTIWYVCANEKL